MSEPAGILETVLYAPDLDAAEGFYRDVLDLEPFATVPGRHLFYRCGNQVVLVFNPVATRDISTAGIPVPPHGADGPGHICFRASAADMDDWHDRLTANGVEIEMDFEWPQGGPLDLFSRSGGQLPGVRRAAHLGI